MSKSIFDRIGDGRRRGHGATFAEPLDAERVQRRRRMQVRDGNGRYLSRRGHAIVHQRLRDEVRLFVIAQLLVQRTANALRHATDDLTVHNERIDEWPRIADYGVLEHAHGERVAIDLHHREVDTTGKRRLGRQEVVRRLQSRLHTYRQSGRPRSGGGCELSEAQPAVWCPAHLHARICPFEVRRRGFEQVRGQRERLLTYLLGRHMRRVSRHDRVATGIGADAERDGVSVAVGDGHVPGRDA